jgi:hypothetical protein
MDKPSAFRGMIKNYSLKILKIKEKVKEKNRNNVTIVLNHH